MDSESDGGQRCATHPEARNDAPWKKFIAFAMVAIMIVAAFALVAPAAKKNVTAPDESQARTEVNGATRSVTYDISRVGWSYL